MTRSSASDLTTPAPRCRICESSLRHSFVDLGMSPLCESFVPPERIDAMEPFYPLHVMVCDNCFLVQLREYVSPENIFDDYAYFSSYSTSWVAHAKAYCEMIASRLGLGADSLVVELASNDGYLLQHFGPLGACPFSASSHPAMSRPSLSKRAFRPRSTFLDGAWRGNSSDGKAADPLSETTCSRTFQTSMTSSAASSFCSSRKGSPRSSFLIWNA